MGVLDTLMDIAKDRGVKIGALSDAFRAIATSEPTQSSVPVTVCGVEYLVSPTDAKEISLFEFVRNALMAQQHKRVVDYLKGQYGPSGVPVELIEFETGLDWPTVKGIVEEHHGDSYSTLRMRAVRSGLPVMLPHSLVAAMLVVTENDEDFEGDENE